MPPSILPQSSTTSSSHSTRAYYMYQDIDKVDLSLSSNDSCIAKSGSTTTSISSQILNLKFLLAALIPGAIFGLAMQKGRVYIPIVIMNQMLLKDFTMMKMFLAACSVGMLITGVLSEVHADFTIAMRKVIKGRSRGYPAMILGGILVGFGMYTSGSCPGTVFSQVGSGVQAAWLTLAGGFAGALIFGISEPYIGGFLAWGNTWGTSATLDELLNIRFSILNVCLSFLMAVLVYVFEVYTPSSGNKKAIVYSSSNSGGQYFFNAEEFSPIIAGALIGSLQLVVMELQSRGLGCSSSYVTVVATTFTPLLSAVGIKSNYLNKAKTDMGSIFQVLFVSSSIAGAALSSFLSGNIGQVQADAYLSYHVAFVGGLVMVFGARMANGCTSGHGLTGSALLSLNSLTGTAAMFGGGIATAFIVQAIRG